MKLRTLAIATVSMMPFVTGTQALAQTATTSPAGAPLQAGSDAAPEESSGLKDIVVTASKSGASTLQTTPIAVSVVDRSLLESQGLTNFKDIAAYVPNVAVSRNIASSIISIRGIGSNGGDPSITTQIDGVYIAGSIAFTDFFDVDRVEVLRGPQGTLYGRNATGGTINFISRTPSSELEGQVRLTYGNYNTVEGSAYLSGPLGDRLRASIAVNYQDHDGYFRNIAPGGHDIGTGGTGGVRAQLRWNVSDDIDATTRVDYSKADQYFESYDHLLLTVPAAYGATLANSLVGSYRDVALNAGQRLTLQSGGVSEDINWRLSWNLSLSSTTAWRALESQAFNDNDATELNLLYFRTSAKTRQFSQEFNLKYASDHFKGVLGLYYYGDHAEPGSYVVQPPSAYTPAPRSALRDVRPVQTTSSYAIFAQGEYEILKDVRLVVGGRYTSETNNFDQNFQATSLNPATLGTNLGGFPAIFSIESKYEAFTPKFGINFQATKDIFLYASATKGFKSGGFNSQGASPLTSGFAPEYIWSYEVGAKTEWLDHRLRVNLTGFYYDYKDLQVRQLLGPGNSIIANAASATIKGVELEIVAKPARDLQLSASGSYLDAKYDSFPTASIPGAFAPFVPNQNCTPQGVCTINASGNYLSDAPKWSGLFAIDYTPTIGAYKLSAHVDYSVRSSRYFDVTNIPLSRQAGYGVLNANLGFGPDAKTGWKIELFARNLTNTKYYQTISGNGIVPGAIVGDPRTYGVRAGYSF